MRILVTGAAGFIGSHIAEFYAKQDHEVICIDNLSRAKLLNKKVEITHNWDYLANYNNIKLIHKDIRDTDIINICKDTDIIFHAAAQTAVTTSLIKPEIDFTTNVVGTFNLLEAARKYDIKSFIYCSTNKVYGDNVNKLNVIETEKRYIFEAKFKEGIPETFDVDLCEHTPYGCSKLAADIYVQDYGYTYGIKAGIFRMSCIYGIRQFGFEDQGWVAWFTIATLLGKPITIYGDGKQVRDILYITDLVQAFDKFIKSNLKCEVFNIGGGPENTISLLELINILKKITGRTPNIKFDSWRPSDQKVYISNINKIKNMLNWYPKISPLQGIKSLISWVDKNKSLW